MAAGFARILAVIDPGQQASPALDRARLFAATASEIHVFACLFDPALSGDHFFDSKRLQKSRAACLQRAARAIEKRTAALARGRAQRRVDVGWGKPFYQAVLRKAAQVQADLLIIGQHDASGARYSNSEWHLVRTCPQPLLLARHRAWADKPVAVASIDPSHRHDKPAALDRKIIEQAARLMRDAKGGYRVFFAYDKRALEELGLRGVAVESRLKQQIKKLGAPIGLSARQIDVAAADPVAAVPGYLEHHAADVVVLGAISRSLIGRVVIGCTAEKLMPRIACDLLIVKPDGFLSPLDFKSED